MTKPETIVPQDDCCIQDETNDNDVDHDDHESLTDKIEGMGDFGHVPVVSRIPKFFRYDGAPIEATGLSIDMYSRATIVMSTLFLGPALLELSNNQLQNLCVEYTENSSEWHQCLDQVKVHGFKPSSLLSNIAVAGGILGAAILPPVGAIVDMTPYRKQVGMYSALFITLVKPMEMMIGPDTWFVVSWLQVLTGVLFCIHVSSIFAYVSELSDDPGQQARYNTHYFVIMYTSTLVFMIQVLAIAWILNTDSVGTAKIALALCTIHCALGFPLAWILLFRDRPPLQKVEQGQSVVFSGFRSLWTTSQRIHRELPALRWLLLTSVFAEGANSAVVTIGTTIMVHFLGMRGRDVGIVFLVILISGPLGSKLGEFIALRRSPVTSVNLCLWTFIVTQTLAAFTLTEEGRSQYTVIFGVPWGLCLGWLHPMILTTFVTIRPSRMDAQMMSLYLFCSTGFTWLPPLVFTICNEYGLHISWSMLSLNIFFLLGILCLFIMGDYQTAIQAGRSMTTNSKKENSHSIIPDDDEQDCPNDDLHMLELPSLS